jgi:chromosome segregation ATPase
MKPETKKLMAEMALKNTEQEIAELKAECKNIKLDYDHVMLIKEDYFNKIQNLTASLKSAVDALQRASENIGDLCIYPEKRKWEHETKEINLARQTIKELKSKHPDMFKGEV